MRLTVLGSSASFAGPGQACSGYLIEEGGARLLIDAGNGTLSNAAAVTDVTHLDAAFVSHTHVDHFLDLFALQAALRFAPSGPVGSMPLYLPEGLWARMLALLPEHGAQQLREAFHAHTIADGQALTFGPLTVTAHAVDHDGPTFAFTVDGEAGRLVYTADTRIGTAARAAVHGADVLLAECTFEMRYAGRGPHLTPAEAAALAAESGASLLVLTHIWPTADRDQLLADARSAFAGEVLLAEELLTVNIDPIEEAKSEDDLTS
jgi:ribonuclease BN (tRNA processing enzyme)